MADTRQTVYVHYMQYRTVQFLRYAWTNLTVQRIDTDMRASSKLKGCWRWRLSPRTLTLSAVQTVCLMIVMFGLVGSLAGGQRGKPVCWWNVSCRWWQQPDKKSAVELAASEAHRAVILRQVVRVLFYWINGHEHSLDVERCVRRKVATRKTTESN